MRSLLKSLNTGVIWSYNRWRFKLSTQTVGMGSKVFRRKKFYAMTVKHVLKFSWRGNGELRSRSPLFEYGLNLNDQHLINPKGAKMPRWELYAMHLWVLAGRHTLTAPSPRGTSSHLGVPPAVKRQGHRAAHASRCSQIRHPVKERTKESRRISGSWRPRHSSDFRNHIQGPRTWVS